MDSQLNPEAPEFHPFPDVDTIAEEGYRHFSQLTHISNTFPIGASYDLFQTYTDFNVVMSKLKKNVLCLASQVIIDLSSIQLKCDNNESNTENVIDANDHLLDRINLHIDTKTGVNRPSAVVMQNAQPAAWNRTPLVTTVKMKSRSASLISAKNIPRPQLSFPDPIDNSDNLFLPRLHNKPNSITPLALTILYDDHGNPTGYEHPYKTELRMYTPPEWALEANEEPAIPPPLEHAPVTYIDSQTGLERLVEHLVTVSEIAIDLEHHSYRSYQGITCLIQISTDEGGDFIVDALALRKHLHLLNQSFTDPTKVKVFHGADRDVQWLQRDFGVYVVGLFDTHQAARLLCFDGLALRHLLHRYCGIEVDKTHQLADWRIRPLPEELIKYARTDTHYLLYVWRRMRRDLLARDPTLLRHAFCKSAQIALTTYVKPRLTEDSHMSAYVMSGKRFTRAQMTALSAAWAWRDAHARELDESPAYLVPNHLLLAVAEVLPRDVQGLRALAEPMPPFLNRNIEALHRIVLASREVPEEPQVLSMPQSMISMLTPQQRGTLHSEHDLEIPSPEESETECELAEEATKAARMSRSDMISFAVPPSAYPTPPASPPHVRDNLAVKKKSQLNADAQIFVPPYQRYMMYRVISQAEEVKTLREKEAKVAALSRDTEVIRQEVLPKLQPPQVDSDAEKKPLLFCGSTTEQKPRSDSITEQKPRSDTTTEQKPQSGAAEENTSSSNLDAASTAQERNDGLANKQRKRKRQDKLNTKNGTKTIDNGAHKDTKKERNFSPYDYEKTNYEMFRREDGKRKKHPIKK